MKAYEKVSPIKEGTAGDKQKDMPVRRSFA